MKVRLDELLVQRGIATTRSRARRAILEGKICIGGEVVLRPGTKVGSDAEVTVAAPLMPYVSRGALKLQGALDRFGISVLGRVAMDVGASTGGFTQILLERGGALVYAVDVGRDQLHPTLRGDPRVVNLEGVDIRLLSADAIDPVPSLVVVDVSFISLRLILPAISRLILAGSDVILLVKPQFEVGRGGVGKGGIVRDDQLRRRAIDDVVTAAQQLGYRLINQTDSPIPGGDGNREHLVHMVGPLEGEPQFRGQADDAPRE